MEAAVLTSLCSPPIVSSLSSVPVRAFVPLILMNKWLSVLNPSSLWQARPFQGYDVCVVTKLLFITTLAPLNLGCHFLGSSFRANSLGFRLRHGLTFSMLPSSQKTREMRGIKVLSSSPDSSVLFP